MEEINLQLVSHIKLLVEPKYGTHLSEKEKGKQEKESKPYWDQWQIFPSVWIVPRYVS